MTSPMKMVTLRSNDDEEFDIPMNVASQSVLIKNTLGDLGDGKVVPLDNVNSAILAKVIEYCKKHAEAATEDGEEANDAGAAEAANDAGAAEAANDAGAAEELNRWDAEFTKLDYNLLFDIVLAANYMEIKSLLDLSCQAIADRIKNKTPEQVRSIFNLPNDFTPEEEAQVRKDYEWAFEDEEN